MKTELEFLEELNEFISENLRPIDAINVRNELFKRIGELKSSANRSCGNIFKRTGGKQ